MTNNLTYRLRLWVCQKIAAVLPESVRRQILYDLSDRVLLQKKQQVSDCWSVTFEEMYNTLRD